VSETSKQVLDWLAALVWLWVAWRIWRNGGPPGYAQPNRKDRPFQFWLVLGLFIALAVWSAIRRFI